MIGQKTGEARAKLPRAGTHSGLVHSHERPRTRVLVAPGPVDTIRFKITRAAAVEPKKKIFEEREVRVVGSVFKVPHEWHRSQYR